MAPSHRPKPPKADPASNARLDRVVADARRARDERELGYREQALKLYPWVCGRCGRGFDRSNLRELTVHHKDMNHDNNPPDGSNWELLCLYCHDNEHQKYEEHMAAKAAGAAGGRDEGKQTTTYRPFGDLGTLLKRDDETK
ncbi:HNH endonuclease [Thioflavicoccus mobilis 8321]|uniref:Putative HNH nuclease YajD n=1 Tax=Thioflavicoccus mobilis 8321 TaxID=765912 RepID=L0H021_9GAMM|nr:YajD family HNH nuclease [Thioflavicoccus mobilis]AGA91412.1 HNH endonuclease [Thioflavicoccus mobilis 8321]